MKKKKLKRIINIFYERFNELELRINTIEGSILAKQISDKEALNKMQSELKKIGV